MTNEELKESVVPYKMVNRVSHNQKKFKGEFDMNELIEFGKVDSKHSASEIPGILSPDEKIESPTKLRGLTIAVKKFSKKDT